MRHDRYSRLTFTFAYYGDEVILNAHTGTGIYVNLNVRYREDSFTEDCKHMVDVFHGWCQPDSNWQEVQGLDVPAKVRTATEIRGSLITSHRRKNLPM